MKLPGKWIDGLTAGTAVTDGVRRILKIRIGAVSAIIDGMARDGGCGAKRVRDLRVAARRADAALRLFRPWIEEGSNGNPACRTLRKKLREIRRAAGVIRDCDIHAEVFKELVERASQTQIGPVLHLVTKAERYRARAEARLLQLADRIDPARLRKWRRHIVAAVEAAARDKQPVPTLWDVARASLPPAIEDVRRASSENLTELPKLHQMRLLLKRLRYSLEILGPALGERFIAEVYPQFQSVQDRLGEVNDGDSVLTRVDSEALRIAEADPDDGDPGLAAGLAQLRQRCAGVRDRRVDDFLEWWGSFDISGLLDALTAALAAASPASAPGRPAASVPRASPAPGPSQNGSHAPPPDAPRRLAAIDVGSNSARLVIAEAYPDGTYRVIDDEKETSRLAEGLARSGRLDPAVMDRAATIVARLRAIAQGYHCTLIRAIATAAVREAANGAEFVDLVRARAGIDLRIISADEEARLAYLSAARAFGDMQTLAAGVVDIGGGSTEIVLSSRGVVDEVYTVPIGAVSLTERFGGPEQAAGPQFKAMQRWVRDQLRRRIPSPALRPELVVGTGGTVTTLAAIAIKRDRSARATAPATVRDYQIRRT